MSKLAFLFLGTFLPGSLLAASMLGGELYYRQVSGLTYEFEARFYEDSNAPTLGSAIMFHWSDDVSLSVPRTSVGEVGTDCPIMRLSVFITQRTMPSAGDYWIGVSPQIELVSGILNVVVSQTEPLCLRAAFTADPDAENECPVFTADQTQWYGQWSTLYHDPLVVDADGDSMSFSMTAPLGWDCQPLPGFVSPDLVHPGPFYSEVNVLTGEFSWYYPVELGYYIVGIKCQEWRNGVLLGSVTRSMTFCVTSLPTGLGTNTEKNVLTVIQPSLDGPVTVRGDDDGGHSIDILDTRGATIQRVQSTGTRTLIATDAMAPGMYLVKMSDEHGAITTGRFVVAR